MQQKAVKILINQLVLSCCLATSAVQSETELDAKVEALVQKMTLEEKVGQMTQLTLKAISVHEQSSQTQLQLDPAKLKQAVVGHHVGSILNSWGAALSLEQWHHVIQSVQDVATKQTRLGIPVLYGIDAVHGHHFLKNATVFPHNLALGATWDRNHVRISNRITALETRASGIPWNFSPVLDVARQPLWSRFFETYSEDPFLVTQLGLAAIEGMQGENQILLPGDRVAACGKHFLGYSLPLSGKDRTPAWIPERQLREIFLPPFKAAIDAGVMTMMINSAEINGIPVHASRRILTELLRDELQFDGVAVTDWEDIIKLHTVHRVAENERSAVKLAILAGIDMSMTPYTLSFHGHLLDLVKQGEISEARIDLSVRRILKLKFRLGLFSNPYPDTKLASQIGSAEAHQASLKAAEAAITLLKNTDQILPLSMQNKVLLTGPGASSLPALHGAWSYSWQGNDAYAYPKTSQTLLQVLQEKLGAEQITHVPGSSYSDIIDLHAVKQAAQKADVILVAIAEKPAVEQEGIIEELRLPTAQIELVKTAQATGKPVILVLLLNRPRIIRDIEPDSRAILMAYYPGMFGAKAITHVLYGDVNPSGKLPFTYPRFSGSLENYNHKASEAQELAFAWTAFNPQWPFGYGLSYTNFAYSDLHLSRTEMSQDQDLQAKVTVTNIGDRAGKEVVQLYIRDLYASVTPAVKKLIDFEKVHLQPQQSEQLSFNIKRESLSFIGIDNQRIVEPGRFQVMLGPLVKEFRLAE